jgi:uncharacterized membrane protein
MAKLKQQLDEWLVAELISPQQAKAIDQYESSKPTRHWVLYGILCVGVSVLAIGIISMIAANWSDISKSSKLLSALFILAVLALGLFKMYQENKPLLFEVGLVLYSALILACIGLLSQVYQTGGDLYQALLFWLVLLSPLVFFTKRAPLPHVWVMVLMGAVVAILEAKSRSWFGRNNDDMMLVTFFVAPLVLAILARLSKVYMMQHAFASVFKFWSFMLACIAVIIIDVNIWNGNHYGNNSLTLAVIGGISLLFLASVISDKSLSLLNKKLLIALAIIYFLGVLTSSIDIESSLVAAAFSIILCSISAVYFVLQGSRRIFNFFAIMITLRFLIVYFDAMGGLAYTGFGLIVSGGIILAAGFAWYKNNARIQGLIEGIKQ